MRLKNLLSVGALGIALLSASMATAQTTTTGAIQGTVTDETTGVPMLLVTVVASSPGLQGTQSEFTDAAGQYMLANLPPGNYNVLFVYGDAKVRRENIDVYVGKVTTVTAKINTQTTGEVITIKERAPTIDAGSTKQGATIEQDYMKNVPNRGRTYDGIIGAAGGAQGDAYGTSFSGSTSLENSYVVDGVNTTGITYGTVGSPVLNNFIQEIEVITGGYNAEFGRATGGVVNVVTKTGSNEFHGSVWGSVTPFEAKRDPVSNAGTALRSESALNSDFDFGFDIGGPIVKDKVWFYVGFAPIFHRVNIDRIASTRVDRGRNGFNYNNPNCARKNFDGTCDGDNDATTTSAAGCELHAPGTQGACEGDGRADLDPASGFQAYEEVDRTRYVDKSTAYQFTAKVNFAVSPDHQGQISFTGSPGSGMNVFSVNGTPTATQQNITSLTTDLSGKWTSKFNNNKTQVDVMVGWHRDKSDGKSINNTLPGDPSTIVNDTPRTRIRTDSYSGVPGTYANLGAVGRNHDQSESSTILNFCTDGDPTVPDQFQKIINCPIDGYQMNSPGFVTNDLEQRVSGKITLTQRLKLAGHHQIKAGLDFENNTIENIRGVTGGKLYTGVFAAWDVFQYVKTNPNMVNTTAADDTNYPDVCGFNVDPNTGDPIDPTHQTTDAWRCKYLKTLPVTGATFNWSGFLQDSWSILPNLTVNAGIRYEQQYLGFSKEIQDTIDPVTGKSIGSNAIALKNLLAPRVGIIYDWTKEGRSKVYANWGRFYESIPMDINLRSFGGEQTYDMYWGWGTDNSIGSTAQCGDAPSTLDPNNPRIPSLPANCPSGPAADGSLVPDQGDSQIGFGSPKYGIPSGVTLVMPGIGPQYMDEIVVGVEYEVLEDLRLGVSYQNRRLGQVIEDMSTDGAITYILGNPGQFDSGEEASMKSQVTDLTAQITAQGSTPDAALVTRRDQLQARLDMFRQIRTFDKPSRDYNAVAVTFAKRFSRAFMVQGSYTYSQLKGNYPGLFSPDTGQLDPNITSQFDLLELLSNRYGPLPFDRPHMFKLDGYYTFDLQKAGRLTAGARIRAQSGVPIQTLGRHPTYGVMESFVLPRGTAGRTDFTANADLHVAYGRKIGNMDLEVYAELFNVLNSQSAAGVDNEYTQDRVNPIVGGTTEDLPYLITNTGGGVPTGSLAIRKLNYLNTNSRISPLTGRVGVTLSF